MDIPDPNIQKLSDEIRDIKVMVENMLRQCKIIRDDIKDLHDRVKNIEQPRK